METSSHRVRPRPTFPIVYLSSKDIQSLFLIKRPQVSRIILLDTDFIGCSKYIPFYKSIKRVAKLIVIWLRNTNRLNCIRPTLNRLLSLNISTLGRVDKSFFALLKNLQKLDITNQDTTTHPKLKKQTMPSLQMLASNHGHYSRIFLAKKAKKIKLYDSFVVNVDPFRFARNLKVLDIDFRDNRERNEINYKNYAKLISYLQLEKLIIREAINGISRFRFIDFLQLSKEKQFKFEPIIEVNRIDYEGKIYYTPQNIFDKMEIGGIESFSFVNIPHVASRNLFGYKILSSEEEGYIQYFESMLNKFPSFSSDFVLSKTHSTKVLDILFKILSKENAKIKKLDIDILLDANLLNLIPFLGPYLDKIEELTFSLTVPKNLKANELDSLFKVVSEIKAPSRPPRTVLRITLESINQIEVLLSFYEAIQHITMIQSTILRIDQPLSYLTFNLLINTLSKSKSIDFGHLCHIKLSHAGIYDEKENYSPLVVNLGHVVLKNSFQFKIELFLPSNNIQASMKGKFEDAARILQAKYFTKIVNCAAIFDPRISSLWR